MVKGNLRRIAHQFGQGKQSAKSKSDKPFFLCFALTTPQDKEEWSP